MTNGQSLGFQDLFGSMFRLFKSNYGILLVFTFAMIGMGLVMALIMNGVGIPLAASTEPGALGPVMIGTTIALLFAVFVLWPVMAYIGYAILRRGRSSSEPRKAGRYCAIVVIGIFLAVLVFPGHYIMASGNPGQYSNVVAAVRNIVRVQATHDENEPHAEVVHEEEASAAGQDGSITIAIKRDQIPVKPGLLALGWAVMIIGSLIALIWIPWAYLAILDPRTEARSAAEALRYGRELNAPVRGPMYGAYIVAALIMVVSSCLCCLPAIFFGLPLILAVGPAFYMAMRGENAPSGDSVPA